MFRLFPASRVRAHSPFDDGVFVKRHLLAGTLIAALMTEAAWADTLREALNLTYRANPVLNAQREVLKSTDATVAIARAGGRPTLGATVGLNRNLTRSGVILENQGDDKNISLSGGADLSVPLFLGGRVRNAVTAAK